MIKLISFDWNGTLLADVKITVIANNIAFKHYGLKPISEKLYKDTFHIPVYKYWLAVGIKKSIVEKMKKTEEDIFRENYERMAASARTRSGCRELLKWLHKNKVESIIYSNHTISGIEEQLERLKIGNYFSKILARSHTDGATHVHERNKEQKLLDYIKFKKLKPHEVISVGDTEEEIDIAKDHGFYSIAISGGHNSLKRLQKCKPDFLISNLSEIKEIAKKLNK